MSSNNDSIDRLCQQLFIVLFRNKLEIIYAGGISPFVVITLSGLTRKGLHSVIRLNDLNWYLPACLEKKYKSERPRPRKPKNTIRDVLDDCCNTVIYALGCVLSCII